MYLAKNIPVVESESDKWRIVRECHEGTGNSVEARAMSGHFGRDKTLALIQSKVYFPSMRKKIEAFLKCQEFYDEVIKADTLWHKKLNSILFTYRTRKHASTKISSYMIMYGRECVMPWELEGYLGPLEDEEDQDLAVEEVIERIYNIREQVLDVAANIKKAQKIQARSYNANTTKIHLKWVTKYGRKIHCGIQNRNCSKRGPNGMVLMKLLRGKLVAMEITC